MSFVTRFANYLLRGVSSGAARLMKETLAISMGPMAYTAGEKVVESVTGFLSKRYTDHGQRLVKALTVSHQKAFRALELALAAKTLGGRLSRVFAGAEDKALAKEIDEWLACCQAGEGPEVDGEFRKRCLAELKAVRESGTLVIGALDPQVLAAEAGALARLDDPTAILDAEREAFEAVVSEARAGGYPALAELFSWRFPDGRSILAATAEWFFRRAVEEDEILAQELFFVFQEKTEAAASEGFKALEEAMRKHQGELDDFVESVENVILDAKESVADARSAVHVQSDHVKDLTDVVRRVLGDRVGVATQTAAPLPPPSLAPLEPASKHIFTGATQAVRAVAFSKDGRSAIVASEDRSVRTFDVASGLCRIAFEALTGHWYGVGLSCDGRQAAAHYRTQGPDLWDVTQDGQSGASVHRFECDASWISDIGFSPDSRLVVAAGGDRKVRLYDSKSGRLERTIEHSGDVRRAAVDAAGERLAVSGSDTLGIYDVGSGEVVWRHPGVEGGLYVLAFLDERHVLLEKHKDLRLVDVERGSVVRTFTGHKGPIFALAVSPDRTRVATGSYFTQLFVHEIATGKVVENFEGHEGRVYAVAFSPDGRWLLSGSDDRTARLFAL